MYKRQNCTFSIFFRACFVIVRTISHYIVLTLIRCTTIHLVVDRCITFVYSIVIAMGISYVCYLWKAKLKQYTFYQVHVKIQKTFSLSMKTPNKSSACQSSIGKLNGSLTFCPPIKTVEQQQIVECLEANVLDLEHLDSASYVSDMTFIS